MPDYGVGLLYAYLIIGLTVFGGLLLVYILVFILFLFLPKTPNKGTFLAFLGGPLVYIYVGRWGKAIVLYILVWITGWIGTIFLWPYSMVNIRTDVRTYLRDKKIGEASLELLTREVEGTAIRMEEPTPVQALRANPPQSSSASEREKHITGKELRCPTCGVWISTDSKFCKGCGVQFLAACNNCGAAFDPDSRFCSSCGASVLAACTKCGALPIYPDAEFCGSCGVPLGS